MTTKKIFKLTCNLPEEDFHLLQYLANTLRLTMTDVIRRGIRDEKFLLRLKEEHKTILVEDQHGNVSEVIERIL